MKSSKSSYNARWGHPRYRPNKGHPNRQARRIRAMARLAKKEQPK